MSARALKALPLFASLLVLSVTPLACSKSSDKRDDDCEVPTSDAGDFPDATTDADASEEPDAGDETDAGEEPDAGPEEPAYTGCDLMEFAPENRDGQGQEYAELFLSLPQGFVPYFSYLQEKSWFAGQTWRFDALTISRWWFDDQAPALAPGIYSLEGVDLDPLNCELCVELNTSNMDLVPPSNEIFQPIEATLNITEVEIGWRGAFKGTLSGRFIETNGTRTWCVNELPFETVFDLYCASIADCPTGATACDYAGNSTIPMCVGE